MSEWEKIVCKQTGETCYKLKHRSGLVIFVWPKEAYVTSYATFATRYGAIDSAFVEQGATEPTVLPAGIAHYLEHKLFENEECDAFERYAKTGANANAYTSFDHTAYLFSCSQNVYDSLEILLDFVQDPYFTEQTVEKERGIIGQEIRMCEDSPARRVFCNLLTALYEKHPVRIDIAGTVESIAEITPELLYACYRHFYDLKNMVLAVAGNVTCEKVEEIADRLLKPATAAVPDRAPVDEPRKAAKSRIEATMPVAVPLFALGYKVPFDTTNGVHGDTAHGLAAAEVLEELIGGKGSPLYASLMEKGLINASFSVEYFTGPGYGAWITEGESTDPDAVARAFREEIARLKREGIDEEAFRAARNAVYGRLISQSDSVEACGDLLVETHLGEMEPFSLLDAVAGLAVQSVYERLLSDFDEDAAALSVVYPPKGD